MHMRQAIAERRSIRRYKTDQVPKPMIEEIIRAGMLAPSSKNRQPWRFTVVTGESKAEALEVMRAGMEREKVSPLLPESAEHIGGAEYTWKIMQQAPVVIFVVNALGIELDQPVTPENRVSELCNTQSVGAAIENMTLMATELGLGSLWICDTYFAYQELSGWLHAEGTLLAALAVGYSDETPSARPRMDIKDMVEYRD